MISLRAPAQRSLPLGLTACLLDSSPVFHYVCADGASVAALALVACKREGRPC
jgi:hypothetical protein